MKRWLRRNLFRSWRDGILTVVFSAIALWIFWVVVRFVVVTGRWEIIDVNLKLLLVGQFPSESFWAMFGVVGATTFWAAAALGGRVRRESLPRNPGHRILEFVKRFGLPFAVGVLLVLLAGLRESGKLLALMAASLLVGRWLGAKRRTWASLQRIPRLLWQVLLALPPVTLLVCAIAVADVRLWGGFLINMYIAVISIVLCFPLGILLSLGRRSSFPIIRFVCATYIEVVRGAPLFVLLLLSGVALDFFIPAQLNPGAVFRSVTVFTLFTAAYLAEIVRGGLQSIPHGQTEAARALGISPTKIILLITLPQALRNVIPAQIGQFISLFKDTTLAGAALSIVEMLKVSEAITKQDAFFGRGYIYEVLAFSGLLFWVGSYVMSKESQRLEKRLGVGKR